MSEPAAPSAVSASVAVQIRALPGRPPLPIPAYATDQAAGLDLATAEAFTLEPGARHLAGTGLALALPEGYEAQVRPRSGLALRHGVTVLNSPGTIDADYRGEVKVILINLGSEPVHFSVGERIAQMVVAPVSRAELRVVTELSETVRGAGGFGHTGR